jgi:hypothetical protein
MRSLREVVYSTVGIAGKCVAGTGVRGCGDDVGNVRGHVDGMWYGMAGRCSG